MTASWSESNGVTERLSMKMFNDPIHGHIQIGGECLKFLDTPQLQRLRYIKQLAAVFYVYSGATHDRLSHSIGTCHLANVALQHLARVQPELEVERTEFEAVSLAALCHDIGHGPFSHLLDHHIIPELTGNKDWHHERRGLAVIDYLVDDNNIDVDKGVMQMAKDLIIGNTPGKNTSGYSRRFLWDIVANGRSSVDVDKFDYLARDSKYCGVPVSFDHRRIMNMMRVVDGEICFNASEAETVYELFAMRSKMHRTVYQHKCVKAIEFMIVDTFKAANSVCKFDQMLSPDNIEGFCSLDDSVIRTVYHARNDGLREAKRIMKRIEKRELYKWVNEFAIPTRALKTFQPVTVDDILRYAPKGATHANIDSNDVIVYNMKIDYGKDFENPVNFVGFYDKRSPDEKFNIESDRISAMLPRDYKDLTVRIYSRTRDESKLDAIRAASEKFQEDIIGAIVQRTPKKRHRMDDGVGEGSLPNSFSSVARSLSRRY